MRNNLAISIVLPSRGRPERLYKLLESIISTADDLTRIEAVVLLDRDDEKNYHRREFGELSCNFFIGDPGRTMGDLNYDCVAKANGDVIFFSNDDAVFMTPKWDTLLLSEISALPSSIYLMYPNDMFKGEKLCTFPIMNRKLLVDYPEIISRRYLGAFIDMHIMDIFKAYLLGRHIKYLHSIVCEHQHYRTNNALIDATYTKRDRFGDDEHFIELAGERARIVSGFHGKTPKEPSWLKENSIFRLLYGSASLGWKLKLFFYMMARRTYRLLLKA